MVDFTSSLKQGLDAAKRADQNRQEVNNLFAVLNTQIAEATDQKVEIVRLSVRDPQTIIGALSTLFEPKQISVIAARHKLDSKFWRQLAKWSQDPYGYPCKISVGDDEMYCENQAALENGLNMLLALPSVGETILATMKHEPKIEKKDSGS